MAALAAVLVGVFGVAIGVFGFGFVGAILIIAAVCLLLAQRVAFIGQDEQIYYESLTETKVINGPKVMMLPILIKRSWKKKALSLEALQYCVVTNSLDGESRVEQGPQLLFLKPYDEVVKGKQQMISLKATEYIRFLDKKTGSIRVEVGEKGRVVPGPNEVTLDGGKQQAINLKCFEFVKIEDKQTGQLRVERGEKLVFLDKHEAVLGSKQKAVEVDEETAVLVRNKRTGQQHLVAEKQLFFPKSDEEILEVRKMIKMADYEACIVRGKDGKDEFYFGKNNDQRSFFLPPYSSLVELLWSKGRRRKTRNLSITKIDLRPMYMSFEFNCRTADNVELVLEGSFFWEVIDLQAMVKYTNDTTGDICNHARSGFIERVSKVTLQAFMNDFNRIAEQVYKDDQSDFYSQRGVQIHSLEVTGYHCAEESTAQTLRAIIKETTNRMNRLQQQESENEVHLKCIKGDIEEELARADLLKVQTANAQTVAEMEGLGEAQKVSAFLKGLEASVPDMNTRMQAWRVLRKKDALREIAQGKAATKLYFTPSDVNLSIENHEHEKWENIPSEE